MSTRTVRTTGLALALALGLSGCGAGLRAQTYQERTAADSTNEAIGSLAVRAIRVLPPRTADGAYAVGSDARVALVVLNESDQDDRLTSVTTDAASSVAVVGPDGREATLRVPGQGVVSDHSFVLRGLTRELRPGNYVTMTLTFAENGTETMLVPVEVTGTPGPRREGYRPAETDSTGQVIPEESSVDGGEGQAGEGSIGSEGGAGGSGVGAEGGGETAPDDGTTGSSSGSDPGQ